MGLGLLLSGCSQSPAPRTSGLHLERQADTLRVWSGQTVFTRFYQPIGVKKPIFWPIIAANGLPITRGWPLEPQPGERVDHLHQVGLWFAHGDVNGLDFWNNSTERPQAEAYRYGTIWLDSFRIEQAEGEQVSFRAWSRWVGPDSLPLLKEETHYKIREAKTFRAIERHTSLRALNDTVRFRDNKEGLFALRVARYLELPDADSTELLAADGRTLVRRVDSSGVSGRFLNQNGRQDRAAWGDRTSWVRLDGQQNGQQVALLMMDHPDNQGYPSAWHTRWYGLFSADNLGHKAFDPSRPPINVVLPPGDSLTFRHQLYIFTDSLPSPAQCAQWYQAWVDDA